MFKKAIRVQSYRQILASRGGQAHVINHFAEAESEAELKLFGEAVSYLQDPKLKKLAEVHREDEVRHVQILHGILQELDAKPKKLPPHMQFIKLIDDSKSIQSRGVIHSEQDLCEFYYGILMIERRTIFELACVAEAAKQLQLSWAVKLNPIIEDERRHLGYCERVLGQIHLPHPQKQQIEKHYQRLEQRAFVNLNRLDLDLVRKQGLVDISEPVALLYKKVLPLLA